MKRVKPLFTAEAGMVEKFRLVVDLYDWDRCEGSRNCYDKRNPLTAGNKIGPPVA
jgi:hypothetical protein